MKIIKKRETPSHTEQDDRRSHLFAVVVQDNISDAIGNQQDVEEQAQASAAPYITPPLIMPAGSPSIATGTVVPILSEAASNTEVRSLKPCCCWEPPSE